MIIAPAAPEDLGLLIAFRDEAARWLAARGIDQWQEPYPTEDLMEEGMLRSIRAGETFIVWDDDASPAATITVDRWANPDLWTPEEAAEPALYAHKLTVARAYAGQGLGGELLDWAAASAPCRDPATARGCLERHGPAQVISSRDDVGVDGVFRVAILTNP